MIRQNTVFHTHAAEKALGYSFFAHHRRSQNFTGRILPLSAFIKALAGIKFRVSPPSLLQHKNHVNIHSALPK
jgi:hypothetical protein